MKNNKSNNKPLVPFFTDFYIFVSENKYGNAKLTKYVIDNLYPKPVKIIKVYGGYQIFFNYDLHKVLDN